MSTPKFDRDLSYLVGWACGVYPLGLIGALDFYLRGARRKAFQALLCALTPFVAVIFLGALLGPRSTLAGPSMLLTWLFLPPLTLYHLRTLDWPVPAPDKRGWVSVIIYLVIIGIVAAIVVPFYEILAVRKKVWVAGYDAEQRVEQYVRADQKLPATNADVGIPVRTDDKFIESLSVGANGVITIRLSRIYGSSVAEKTVIFTPHLNAGAVTWSCDGGTLPDKYLSYECRHKPPGQFN